jgi:hypothetical protein
MASSRAGGQPVFLSETACGITGIDVVCAPRRPDLIMRALLSLAALVPVAARIIVPLPSASDLSHQITHTGWFTLKGDESPSSPVCEGGVCRMPSPRPLARLSTFCDALAQLRHESDGAFAPAATLLLRYCENAASGAAKCRRIRLANKAFQRSLGPFPSAAVCLRAVGFEEMGGTVDDNAALVLRPDVGDGNLKEADVLLLRAAATALEREWPAALLADFNTTFAMLYMKPKLLDALFGEVRAGRNNTRLPRRSPLRGQDGLLCPNQDRFTLGLPTYLAPGLPRHSCGRHTCRSSWSTAITCNE